MGETYFQEGAELDPLMEGAAIIRRQINGRILVLIMQLTDRSPLPYCAVNRELILSY
jgi:hypothetical protein